MSKGECRIENERWWLFATTHDPAKASDQNWTFPRLSETREDCKAWEVYINQRSLCRALGLEGVSLFSNYQSTKSSSFIMRITYDIGKPKKLKVLTLAQKRLSPRF